MKRPIILLLFLFMSSITLSCSTVTQPNLSALYRISALRSQLPSIKEKPKILDKPLPPKVQMLFEELYRLDSALALEVGKLPEFQDDIGEKQILSLSRFVSIITKASPKEKSYLGELLKIGIPNIRRYCTPLQAIFWVLEKDEYDPEENPLRCNWPLLKMCLYDLLGRAWDFSEKDRWRNYKTVVERLNAPELVDYYQKVRFTYVFRPDHVGQPYTLFKTNEGQCVDVTVFTVDCLTRGGYRAWEHKVPSPTGHSYHMVTLFEVDGRKYIMDNGRPDKRGILPLERYSPW